MLSRRYYEPRTPASTCEIGSIPIIGGIISGVGSIIGGSQAADAAEDGSDAQVRAAEVAAGVQREALGFQREVYDVGRADLAPYRATGATALRTMNNMFLPGGQPVVQMQGRLNELRAERARLMSAPQLGGDLNPAAGAGALVGGQDELTRRFIDARGDLSKYFRDEGQGGDPGDPGGHGGSGGPGEGSGDNQSGPR